MAPAKFDLPDAIMIGGLAVLADFLSIIPGFGLLFLLTFWGIFKMMRLSAPFPWASMFVKIIPLISLTPLCTGYVWRVYKRNQIGGVMSAVTDVADPKVALASTVALKALSARSQGDEQQKEAA